MDKEFRFGQMVQDMKETGIMTWHQAMVNYITQIMMYMKESGRRIKQMEEECIHMLMALNTMENGRMISNMDMEKSLGLMGLYMKDNTMMERRMVKVNSYLQMEAYMKVSSL